MKWKVEVNGRMTIVEARTKAAAIRDAVEGFVTVRASKATKEDIAWYESMSNPVIPRQK